MARLQEHMESLLDRLADRKGIHAAIMGVASGDGELNWIQARGSTGPDGAPMTPDTPFFIASITKLFVAAAIMRLVEEGDLDLGDRLVDHLPPSITDDLHQWKGEDRTPEIKVEHLLAHASGLPDFIEDVPVREKDRADRRTLVEILTQDGDQRWTLEDTANRVRASLRPHFPPQRLDEDRIRIRYSDTNYQLLMAIIEESQGLPFAEALDALVLEPLGLSHTWIPGHERTPLHRQAAASVWFGDRVVEFPLFFSSIGDLNATAGDLLQFFRGIVQGRLFRTQESWSRMQARWNRFSHPRDRAALRQPSWPIEYGLGVMRFQLPRFLTPFKPLPPVVGHTGSTGTWLFHAPEQDLYLVGAANQITAGPVPFRLVPRILRAARSAEP